MNNVMSHNTSCACLFQLRWSVFYESTYARWCSSGGLWCSVGAAVVQQRWLPGGCVGAAVVVFGAALVQQWCSNAGFLVQRWCSSGGLWCSVGAAVVQQRWLPGGCVGAAVVIAAVTRLLGCFLWLFALRRKDIDLPYQ